MSSEFRSQLFPREGLPFIIFLRIFVLTISNHLAHIAEPCLHTLQINIIENQKQPYKLDSTVHSLTCIPLTINVLYPKNKNQDLLFVNRFLLILILTYPFLLTAQLPDAELIFQSGFEPGCEVVDQQNTSGDLSGIDNSLSSPNDWDNDFDDHPNIGSFRFQFQDGDTDEREASIIADPSSPGNHILNYRISDTDDDYARIQADVYDNVDLKNIYYSTRLYLPHNFNTLKEAPFEFSNITLMEFWNNASWTGEGRQFKMTLNLVKTTTAIDSLHFRFRSRSHSSNGWSDILWGGVNEDFIVPVGQWMKIEVYFQEGNSCQGRFVIKVTPEGETPVNVYDIKNCTNHPYDTSPDGLAHFNPMKFYMEDEIIEYVSDTGNALDISWDDFQIWKDSIYLDPTTEHSGSITLNTQTEVDNFATTYANIHTIFGDLNILSGSDDPILNLDALSLINRIQGNLIIEENNDLTNLNGLENLRSIGGNFELKYNPALITLSLDSLTCIGTDFQYTGNENVANFSELTGLIQIGRHLEIRKSGLVNLNGLELLERLGGRLVLEENDNLDNLDGLINLRDMTGNLSILDNPSLPNLSGLINIKPADIEFLFINDNTNLTFCHQENICEYIENGSPAQIMNNGPGCLDLLEVTSNCGLADVDMDGFLSAVDCDDNNPNINPAANEIWNNDIDEDCNGIAEEEDNDQDGFNILEDCNDNNNNINPAATEITYNGLDDDCNAATLDDDLDQDGYNLAVDCDDNDPSINPGATEVPGNGIDENCDNSDELVDLDNDGFNVNDDCDDNNPNVNPNATEVPYNGLDDDCNPNTLDDDLDQDGYALINDCNDNNPNIYFGNTETPYNNIDDDCDPSTPDDDLDNDGFNIDVDCDDNNPDVNPSQTEIAYNDIDDDCDPNTLDDDFDMDGYGENADCDDDNPNINPGVDEIPYNGIDDDCDPNTFDDDVDMDGYLAADDCNDFNNSINPGMPEIPNNGIDENCDGLDGLADVDNDGYLNDVDCNDTNPDINPGATEIPYNGFDDDCNSLTLDNDLDQDGFDLNEDCDDNNPNINPAATEIVYNGIDDDCNQMTFDDDLDQDGFLLMNDCDDTNPDINPGSIEIPYNNIDEDCNPLTLDDDIDLDGFPLAEDCNDMDPAINPNAAEIPSNGIDENCNGLDEFVDADADGYFNDVDCDDTNPEINPSATEIPYNNIDDDCDPNTFDDDLDQDGFILAADCDDSNPMISPGNSEILYNGLNDDCNTNTLDDDLDQDGYFIIDDCNDNDPSINPLGTEILDNAIDEDCNGSAEQSNNSHLGPQVYPNPTSGKFTITGLKDASMKVRNLSGDDIFITTVESDLAEFDFKGLSEGIYILTFLTKEEFISMKLAIFEE